MQNARTISTKYAIGVDLGGTNLRAAVVDADQGLILCQRKCPTQAHEGHEAVICRMVQLIQAVILDSGLHPAEIKAAGIGVPGTPDLDTGAIQLLPNFPGQWRNLPLGTLLQERTGLAVFVLNDVRAMTLAEWTLGAGRGVDTLACFAIGTGIGGGLVVNGKLHLGIGGTAGEFGHTIVEPQGLLCSCGGRGCLELYASGPAIAAMGVKEVMHGHTTLIGTLAGYDLNQVTPELITRAAIQGDPAALEILHRAGNYLGIAVSNVVSVISPRRVIFGGGVAQAGELLLMHVRNTVREHVHVVPVDQVEFVQAALGNVAGLVGAALWAANKASQA